jgi:dihydrofolate synthase/folylpolyglutamate synthase
MAYLGNSLEEIAANKAGIIKPGVPVVVGPMEPNALQVIADRAKELGAELYDYSQTAVSRVAIPSLQKQTVNIKGPQIYARGLEFSLQGDYQLDNLATAVTALQIIEQSGYKVDESSIREALVHLRIPGRLEIIRQNPLVIADAAHNPQGAKALSTSLESLFGDRQKILVLGLVDDKERDAIIQPLGKNTRTAIITRPQGPRGSAWKNVKTRWQQIHPGIPVLEIEKIADAVTKGLEMVQTGEYLVLTGSFYVLDQARRVFVGDQENNRSQM